MARSQDSVAGIKLSEHLGQHGSCLGKQGSGLSHAAF